MAITYITFIECTIKDRQPQGSAWKPVVGIPHREESISSDQFWTACYDDAEVDLVDIGYTRRYYGFKKDGKFRIKGNVFIFDDEWAKENPIIDESKQFPKKKRIDE